MAKSFNLTAKINAQLGNIRPVVQSLKRQLTGIKANVAINIAPTAARNIGQLSRALANLNGVLQQTAAVSRQAAQGLNQLGQAAGGHNFANLARQAAQINRALGNVQRNTRQARSDMEEFGRVSGLAIRRFSGFTIATGVVFGFVNAINDALKAAVNFDQELIRIGQATETSKAGVGNLSREISRLATSLGVQSEALADVSLTLVQAGLTARDTKIALESIAKSSLAPTFTDIKNTVEGSISAMSQFSIGAEDLGDVLGSVNAVSAKFAVESDDIIAAIRRTGGVFAAASKGVSEGKDALNEFIAVFTSVRATTRESAETIATGLRTIFTRLQRSDTIRNLEELGIQLTDSEGKFIGAYNAVDQLAKGLKQLDPRDLRFSEIVEELGGFRQVSKVIPLIAQTEKRVQALKVAQEGKNSLDKDSERAQESLANKIAKVREEFKLLIREVTETSSFKVLVDTTLQLTKGLIDLARAIKPLIPLLAVVGGIQAIRGATLFTRGFARGVAGRNDGGYAPKFHSGGLVPGGKGTKDDYPATLQEGEYVIRQKAVDSIGVNKLDKLNAHGRKGFASGGIVGQNQVGAAVLKSKLQDGQSTSINFGKDENPYITGPRTFDYTAQGISRKFKVNLFKDVDRGLLQIIDSGSKSLGGKSLAGVGSATNLLKTSNREAIQGSLFEAVLNNVSKGGVFSRAEDPSRPFDFINGLGSILKGSFDKLTMAYIDARRTDKKAQPGEIKKKIALEAEAESKARNAGKKPTATSVETVLSREDKRLSSELYEVNRQRALKKNGSLSPINMADYRAQLDAGETKGSLKKKRLAGDQPLLGKAQGGEVPAILTRGEYVLQKSAADSIGKPTLDRLNHADKYHTGGLVGLARGGYAPSGATTNAVSSALAAGINPNELINTFRRLEAVLGNGTRELDRAIRGAARSFERGDSAAQAFTNGIRNAERVNRANRGALMRNASNFIPGRGRYGGQTALAAGFGAATLAGQFDQQGTNPVLQGLTGAFTGASIGGYAAGPYGAAAGAIVGGISSAAAAQNQKVLNESVRRLSTSTKELNRAFEELTKSGKTLTAQNSTQVFASSDRVAKEFGPQATTVSSSDLLPFFDSSTKQRYGKAISDTLADNAADAGASARTFLTNQINAGVDINKFKSPEARGFRETIALTSGAGTDYEKGQLGLGLRRRQKAGGADAEAQSRIDFATNNIFDRVVKEAIEAKAAADKLAAAEAAMIIASGQAAKELDRFFDRLNQLSAAFNRVGESITSTQVTLDNIANRDNRTTHSQNVFSNIEGFNQNEIKTAGISLNRGLGNSASSRELVNNAIGASQGKQIIADVVAQATQKSKINDDEDVKSFVTNELQRRLSGAGLNETVVRGIVSKVDSQLRTRKDDETPLDEKFFTSSNLESLANEDLDKILKTTAQAFETLNATMDQFENGMSVAVRLRLTENQAFANAARLRSSTQLESQALRLQDGQNLPLQNVLKPFEDSIKGLTGGKTNPADIAKNITSLQTQVDSVTNQASRQRASGDVEGFRKSVETLGSLRTALEENKEALQSLSQDTSILSEVQKRLADMETKKQQAEKTLQELAFGNKADQVEFGRRANLANQLLAGRQLQGPNLEAALKTIAELGQVLNASGVIDDKRKAQIDRFGQETLAKNPRLNAIFGGVDPGLKKIRGLLTNQGNVERDKLLATADAALKRQADAAIALANIQSNTNRYIQVLNDTIRANTIELQNRVGVVAKNSGGIIPGDGPNVDSVPAYLTKGEFVVNRDATKANLGLLMAINNGYNNGGPVRGSKDPRLASFLAKVDRQSGMKAKLRSLGYGESEGIRDGDFAIMSKDSFKQYLDKYANHDDSKNSRIEDIAKRAASGMLLQDTDREFIRTLTTKQKALGSSLFNTYKRAAKLKDSSKIGNLGKAHRASVKRYNKGGMVSSTSNNAGSQQINTNFGQHAQLFASAAASLERAASILSKINIPSRIDMQGNHTVQVVINGADVLGQMNEPIRQLVTSEIKKALSRHVNVVTGETNGDFNA